MIFILSILLKIINSGFLRIDYVAATVFGALIRRVVSGIIATSFSYEYVFYSLFFTIFISLFFVKKLSFEGETKFAKPKLKDSS
jgi:YNFM family putative membrane transporter